MCGREHLLEHFVAKWRGVSEIFVTQSHPKKYNINIVNIGF